MRRRGIERKAWLALALAVAALIPACQGGAATSRMAGAPLLDGFTAQDALRDLAGLTAPAGVDPVVFDGLKSSLAAMLEAQPGQRFTAAAPCGCAGKVADLIIYSNGDGSATCSWTYCNSGDYDQNSQVTINDLTPVGQHYRRKDEHPLWPLSKVADGDLNGEINISDITPIGMNMASTVEGYRLQTSATGDVEGDWAAAGDVPFSESSVPSIGGPRWFSHVLPAAQMGAYFRVAPVYGAAVGEPSDPVQYSGDPAPAYSVSGTCADHTGAGLSGVDLALDGQPATTSDSSGAYNFSGLGHGYLGYLTATHSQYTVLPRQRAVLVAGSHLTGQNFTAFPADHVKHNLPSAANAGAKISVTLEVVDAAGATLAGFDTEAAIVITPPAPAGLVNIPVQFTGGAAEAEVSFAVTGTHDVSVSGLGEHLDGPLGQVDVTVLDPPALSAAVWRHNAEAAISLTFDDGSPDHWARGLPLWHEYGFHVTLAVLASKFQAAPERIPQLQEAFDAGHELANHTSTHSDLTTLTKAQVRTDLQDCQDMLLDNVKGLKHVLTVVYPYLAFNDDVIAVAQDMGYLFARSGPQDMVEVTSLNDAWNPPYFHLYSWANLNNLPAWMWDDTVIKAVNTGSWLIEQCHGIGAVGETGVGWSPQPESAFRAHYDHIKSYGDRVWVAPLSEVGRYIMERNQAQFNVLSFTGDELSFIPYDALDDEIYDVPLTVRMQQSPGWTGASAEQGLAAVPVKLDQGYFFFDVTPSGGIVRVTRQP